jgi:putative sterol carrier protein
VPAFAEARRKGLPDMSEIIEKGIEALKEKLSGQTLASSVKFVVKGEGAIRIDGDSVTADDSDADVTLTADADTFRGILEGDVNPTTAYMMGRLKLDGDMGVAMKLGALLA